MHGIYLFIYFVIKYLTYIICVQNFQQSLKITTKSLCISDICFFNYYLIHIEETFLIHIEENSDIYAETKCLAISFIDFDYLITFDVVLSCTKEL